MAQAMAHAAMVVSPCVTVGTINFHETHISAWEEHVTPGVLERFRSVLARLRDHRGFRLQQDQSVHKLIRRGYYNGRKGDLELYARQSGRMFEIEFFQNLNIENRNGGRYDFQKWRRMPRTMQLACAVEMSHVIRKLLELGYVLSSKIARSDLLSIYRHAQGRTDEGDPLATFNRHWGSNRFERDESGWPSMREFRCLSTTDRDGLRITSGDVMYCRRAGRLFRGVVRPGPNDSWIVLSNGRAEHVPARGLFRCDEPAAEPRRLIPKQAERVRRELAKALAANDYRRVEALARVARRVCTSEAVANG